MGTTKHTQKQTKADFDQKLKMGRPTRQILEELAIACVKDKTQDNTFQYAFCLAKSTDISELRYAVEILDGLVKEGYEHQVDCVFGAGCALYLLGDYEKARQKAEGILRSHPDSKVARELHLSSMEAMDEQTKKKRTETAIGGAAIAVGVAAGIAGMMMNRKR